MRKRQFEPSIVSSQKECRRSRRAPKIFLLPLALLLLCTALVAPATAQTITAAAAADLRPALQEIAANFESQSGIHVSLIYGSSGNFYQQIQNGAPFDLFLSANTDYPKRLEAAGLVVEGSYYEYAQGAIVLLVRSSSLLNLGKGPSVLLDPAVKKISIADPSHAPYGAAAVAALKAENLYQEVSPKIVTAENISQAESFVLSGAADVGIVALSLALAPEEKSQVRYVAIPPHDYPPIRQAGIVLRASRNQKSAIQFESYLRSEEAAKVFRQYGFQVPDAKSSNTMLP
jgi:molybdate transport system substrate-binding protein